MKVLMKTIKQASDLRATLLRDDGSPRYLTVGWTDRTDGRINVQIYTRDDGYVRTSVRIRKDVTDIETAYATATAFILKVLKRDTPAARRVMQGGLQAFIDRNKLKLKPVSYMVVV